MGLKSQIICASGFGKAKKKQEQRGLWGWSLTRLAPLLKEKKTHSSRVTITIYYIYIIV